MSTRKLWMAGSALLLVLLVVWLMPTQSERGPIEPEAEPVAAAPTPSAHEAVAPEEPAEPGAEAQATSPAPASEPQPAEPSAARDEAQPGEPARVVPRKRSIDALRLHFVTPPSTVPGIAASQSACAQLLERQSRGDALAPRDLLRLRLECRAQH